MSISRDNKCSVLDSTFDNLPSVSVWKTNVGLSALVIKMPSVTCNLKSTLKPKASQEQFVFYWIWFCSCLFAHLRLAKTFGYTISKVIFIVVLSVLNTTLKWFY